MKIGVISQGYVGLPLAVAFAEAGHEVVGLDADQRKVENVNAGRSHVEDISDSALRAGVAERAPAGDHASR